MKANKILMAAIILAAATSSLQARYIPRDHTDVIPACTTVEQRIFNAEHQQRAERYYGRHLTPIYSTIDGAIDYFVDEKGTVWIYNFYGDDETSAREDYFLHMMDSLKVADPAKYKAINEDPDAWHEVNMPDEKDYPKE